MRRTTRCAWALWAASLAAHADPLYLVIAASAPEPAAIAARARALHPHLPQARIVQMTDCGEPRRMFAVVAAAADNEAEARAGASMIRPYVADAYVKRCEIAAGSLLAAGVDAVDASIADVPPDAVNWDDAERISEARALPDGRTLVVQRVYAPLPDDALEGRRERLLLAAPGRPRVTLSDSCANPGRAATRDGNFALHCAREQAGPYVLHSVLVFAADGTQLAEITHCRDPRWRDGGRLACAGETVTADGKLLLVPQRASFPAVQ